MIWLSVVGIDNVITLYTLSVLWHQQQYKLG